MRAQMIQNTCPFIHNADKITGPKQSIKITDRFTCTSANVIYCITSTLCKKIYIDEKGRIGDRFRKHLRDVERNDKDTSKAVTRHFNLPNHCSQHMTISGLSLHQGNTESRKKSSTKLHVSNWHTIATVSMNASHSINLFLFFTLPCSYQ